MKTRRSGLAAMAGGVAGLLLLTSAYLWLLGPAPAVIGGPFTLVRGDGQAVTDRSFRGKYLLIYFGYTACEDVCPITLSAVAEALDALGPRAGGLQPLFITIDPARDTPAAVARYAASFSPRFIGLTGTPAEITRIARQYHAASIAQHNPDRIDHTSVLYLVGPDGRYLAPVRANESGAQMAKDLTRYLS